MWAGPDWFINGDAVNSGADTGDSTNWRDGRGLNGCQLFMSAVSAGTPVLTLTIDISPVEKDDSVHAPANFSETFTVTASGAKAFKWYSPAAVMAVLDRPIGQYRLKVAVASADCTAVYAGVIGGVNAES